MLQTSENHALAEVTGRIIDTQDSAKLLAALPLFRVKGQPYSINDHFFFKPLFRIDFPRRGVYKCARQVGKTQNMAASKLTRSVAIPHYNILFVCPRFEQIKRISNNYVKPLIQSSPARSVLIDTQVSRDQSILQRTFKNGSIHYYSFAFLDAERIRSISCNDIAMDEVQDIIWDFIPVIAETLSGSPRWRQQLYTGTPKTMDNTIEKLWRSSSMGEWAVQCEGCNHWNIAGAEYDLLKMIGKKGVICVRCGKLLQPRHGGWVFPFSGKAPDFVGYHIPQVVHPYHYEYGDGSNWKDLLYKMSTYPQSKFWNECLGESFDSATKLISMTDLTQISLSQHPNSMQHGLLRAKRMNFLAVGIDWTGGGVESKSYTALVVAGVRPGQDTVEVVYATRFKQAMSPNEETVLVLDIIKRFQPDLIAHDYGGAGNLREVMMVQAGVPQKRIVPYTYSMTANKQVIYFNPGGHGTRSSYTIDKPRSLVTLCAMMRAKKVLLPSWGGEGFEENPFLDFFNLGEEVQERPRGSDVILVTKSAESSDDVCHALNYAASSIWYHQQRYPDLAEAMQIKLTQEEINSIAPKVPEW